MYQPDTEKEVEALLKRIRRAKSLKYRFKPTSYLRYAAAAAVLGILVAGYLFKDRLELPTVLDQDPVVETNTIVPGTDKATLTLENGDEITLGKGTTYESQTASSNGEEIIYKDKGASNAMAYNYLTVPRGGEFFLMLSDGTKVWLNSESQLKYPVQFNDGESRQVELVYGEAYFEVTPSTEHKGSNFKVANSQQVIEVLGTKFNIKAYRDESDIYTTLVEGKVSVSTSAESQLLAPNLQSVVNSTDHSIKVSKVDTKSETAWIHGDFVFQGKSLREIMKVLSRWYNVDIQFDKEILLTQEFNGELSKNQNIDEILEMIKSTEVIQNYTIRGSTIILK